DAVYRAGHARGPASSGRPFRLRVRGVLEIVREEPRRMSTMAMEGEEFFDREFGKWWWVLLITGTAWLFLSLIMFRFDITSVKSIGILAGIFFICAAVLEFLMIVAVRRWYWKVLNGILGAILLVGGINAFARPGDAFIAIASITGFMFLFVGI